MIKSENVIDGQISKKFLQSVPGKAVLSHFRNTLEYVCLKAGDEVWLRHGDELIVSLLVGCKVIRLDKN